MDAFQDLFNNGDNWPGDTRGELLVDKGGGAGRGGEGDVSSADSTTPPPSSASHVEADKLAKSANSIRGS